MGNDCMKDCPGKEWLEWKKWSREFRDNNPFDSRGPHSFMSRQVEGVPEEQEICVRCLWLKKDCHNLSKCSRVSRKEVTKKAEEETEHNPTDDDEDPGTDD